MNKHQRDAARQCRRESVETAAVGVGRQAGGEFVCAKGVNGGRERQGCSSVSENAGTLLDYKAFTHSGT